MRNILKKSAVALLGLSAGLPVFAQEGASGINTDAAADAIDDLKEGITGLFTDNIIPAVLAVVGVGLAVALIYFGVRALMRAGKTSSR